METNENMALEVIETTEIMDATEEIVNASSSNLLKTATGVGLVVLGGVIAYKYAYKPIRAKLKAKKEKQDIEIVEAEEVVDTNNEDVQEDTFDETEQ